MTSREELFPIKSWVTPKFTLRLLYWNKTVRMVRYSTTLTLKFYLLYSFGLYSFDSNPYLHEIVFLSTSSEEIKINKILNLS